MRPATDPTIAAPDPTAAAVALADELAPLQTPRPGIGLCLSGGGFRAMLYHVGALWRLQEIGLLSRLDRISSVSGGSITSGWLACVWTKRNWPNSITKDEFFGAFVEPLLDLAGQTIDIPSVLLGFLPWCNVGREVARRYDVALFRGMTLHDLPDTPRFVFNSSNLQTGALWRFSKPYMADWKVGKVNNPDLSLSHAVAASSAFPPFLSPFRLKLKGTQFQQGLKTSLGFPPYTTRPVLSDGGVYDNLGLETVFKNYSTVLVSDGGAPFKVQPRPTAFWPLQLLRVVGSIDNQVRSLRKRNLIEAFEAKFRTGAYWGIASPLAKYPRPGPLPCSPETTLALASICTRLGALDQTTQHRLINWGYASSAASLESHFPQSGPVPTWPFPDSPLD